MDNTRKVFVDVLRIVATLFVIAYHILISFASNVPNIDKQSLVIFRAFSATMQWHIPIFFMITGYLWLSIDKDCTYKKMLPNIRRFILVLFTVGYGYAIMERVFYSKAISFNTLRQAFVDVLLGKTWDHMWFLYAIIGIYLLLPIIKSFFDSQSTKIISIFVSILFFFALVVPATEYILGYSFPIDFPVTTPFLYVCIGGLLTKIKVPNILTSIWALIVLICNSIVIFITETYNFLSSGLLPLFICISALSLFLALYGIFYKQNNIPWIGKVSICTFGIYLIHPFFINLIIKVFHIYPIQNTLIISIFLIWIVIVGLSYLIIYLLRKISLLRKYIL